MSSRTPHEPESFAGLLLEQPLDFQLCFGGASEHRSQVEHRQAFGRFAIECGFDEHESRASQDPIDQKEVVEPIRVDGRNPPPFHSRHSNVLPALFGATRAREILEHNICLASSKFDSAPHYYGVRCFKLGTLQPERADDI